MSKIDTSEWKSFIIGDLFNKLNLGIKNPNFNKALDVSEKRQMNLIFQWLMQSMEIMVLCSMVVKRILKQLP